VAEASLALPPGPTSTWPVAVSAVLLLATGLEFLLPWPRLPRWLPVLVPLTYTGSVLALILAAGPSSGVGIVILIPLIWTVLFGARLESGCVVAAIVAVEVIISLTPAVAPGAVIARRVLLWAALGVLISVATHGLRDRIRYAQDQRALLQDQLRALTVLEDRDRIAADLRDGVIQRVFAAGLTLQGGRGNDGRPGGPAPGRVGRRGAGPGRPDAAGHDLRAGAAAAGPGIQGGAAQPVRRPVAGSGSGLYRAGGWRAGPGQPDPAGGAAPGWPGAHKRARRIKARAAATGESGPDLAGLRSMAAQSGVHIEIHETPGGIRFAWRVPLGRPLSAAGR